MRSSAYFGDSLGEEKENSVGRVSLDVRRCLTDFGQVA